VFNSSLINDSFQPLGQTITLIGLMFGQKQRLKLYNVCLKSSNFGCDEDIWTPAAAVDGLFMDVIVGNSIFDSPKLIDTICRPRDVQVADVSKTTCQTSFKCSNDLVSAVDTDSDRETDDDNYKTRGDETRAAAAVGV